MKPSFFLFKVSTRHIINKLFFDIAPEDNGTTVDPESLQVIKHAVEFIQCSEFNNVYWQNCLLLLFRFQNELDRMKAVLSVKGKTEIISSSYWLVHPSIHPFIFVCLHVLYIPEKEWRDKQKSVDTLKDTIEKQKKDLDRVRKEIGDKEMLCSVLRVRVLENLSISLACFLH